MTKREKVYNKFNGKCAYTGTPLESDWQIDHMESMYINSYYAYKGVIDEKNVNSFEETSSKTVFTNRNKIKKIADRYDLKNPNDIEKIIYVPIKENTFEEENSEDEDSKDEN